MGWIRIRLDPELLPGSGSRTQIIQSWIRIRNKSFRIRNSGFQANKLANCILAIFAVATPFRIQGLNIF